MRFQHVWPRRREYALAITLWLSASSVCACRAQCLSVDHVSTSGGYVKNCGSSRVIVFVHGLFSNPEVWRNEINHSYWPKMIAADDDAVFADMDVYVAGYDTPQRGNKNTMTDLQSQIVNRFDRDNVFRKHKEVIFVAHSMGGLLVQQILLTYRDRDFNEKVRTILLYGTPQEGSHVANLAKFFSPDPLLKELESGDNNFVLHDIDQRWLHSDFKEIRRYCAYETRKEKGFKVVDRDSATRGCYNYISIAADHHHLVEPHDVGDDSYTFLKNSLRTEEARLQPQTKPVAATSGTPIVVKNLATPYSGVEGVSRDMNSLDYRWNEGLRQINRQFMEPYRHGFTKDPIPLRLPGNLVEELAELDRSVDFQYTAMRQTIIAARDAALECMQLTPNQMIEDRDRFRAVDVAASMATSIPKLETNTADGGRFGGMVGYLHDLKNKLGDYQCSIR